MKTASRPWYTSWGIKRWIVSCGSRKAELLSKYEIMMLRKIHRHCKKRELVQSATASRIRTVYHSSHILTCMKSNKLNQQLGHPQWAIIIMCLFQIIQQSPNVLQIHLSKILQLSSRSICTNKRTVQSEIWCHKLRRTVILIHPSEMWLKT
jgi:hypothetical protein